MRFPFSHENFIKILNDAASSINVNLNIAKPKDSYRLKQSEPASNKSKFIDLINASSVYCIRGATVQNLFPYKATLPRR